VSACAQLEISELRPENIVDYKNNVHKGRGGQAEAKDIVA